MGMKKTNIIKEVTDDAAKRSFNVRIRDIAYALMRVKFDDDLIPYTVVFGQPEKDNDVTDYEKLDSTQYLIRWFKKNLQPEAEEKEPLDAIKAIQEISKTSGSSEAMSFEDNRAGIEKQIDEILELKKQLIDEDGKVTDVKTMATLQKTEADLRSKLNDKFGASEKSSEQYIIVQPKFNTICEHTRKECWQQTREFAMKHWHLIPDPKYKGE